MTNRYAATRSDAVQAEHAARERERVERSYRHMLALSDGMLGKLEQRNLAGQRELDEVIQRELARTLQELDPRARGRFPLAPESVQEALDGVFDVQEELMLVLQRMLHWERVLNGPWEADDAAGERQQLAV